MDPMLISAGVQALSGIGQAVQGIGQRAAAKKIMRSNPRPTYYIPKAEKDNLNLAENKAGQGMSDASRQVYDQGTQRDLNNSIEGIIKAGGSANNIGDVYGKSISGRQRMAILDDEMRSRNIQNLIQQQQEMANYQDKEWQVNVYAPYADKAQAAATLMKQGSDNINKGINTVGGAATNYLTGQMFKKEGDNVYGKAATANTPSSGWTDSAPSLRSSADNSMADIMTERTAMTQSNSRPKPGSDLSSKWPGLMYGSIYDKTFDESGGLNENPEQ